MVGNKSFDDLEADENVSVSVSDGELTINGSTNQEGIDVTFVPQNGDDSVTNSTDIHDGSFTVTLSGLESGSGELVLEAGPAGETDEVAVERRASIQIESSSSD